MDSPAVPAMLCCSVLLLLVCGSLAASHPQFWTTSSTSSPGSGRRIRNLERSRLTGRNMDQMAPEGNDQSKRIPSAASRDVTRISLLPKCHCRHHYFFRCPDKSSIRRNLQKEKFRESLRDARVGRALVEQAVLQALGGRYKRGYKH